MCVLVFVCTNIAAEHIDTCVAVPCSYSVAYFERITAFETRIAELPVRVGLICALLVQ